MNKHFLFLIAIGLFLLSGCTTLSPPSYRAAASENWILQGKAGIKTSQKTESASLYWQQQGDIYDIRLFGPLGVGAVTLKGKPEQVIFTDARGKIYQAYSAENLLAQKLGWQLPVENLKYWVRALPAPDFPAQKVYEEKTHRLKILIQQGWKIDYLSYTVQLPRLIQLTRPGIVLRIVIDRWQ